MAIYAQFLRANLSWLITLHLKSIVLSIQIQHTFSSYIFRDGGSGDFPEPPDTECFYLPWVQQLICCCSADLQNLLKLFYCYQIIFIITHYLKTPLLLVFITILLIVIFFTNHWAIPDILWCFVSTLCVSCYYIYNKYIHVYTITLFYNIYKYCIM